MCNPINFLKKMHHLNAICDLEIASNAKNHLELMISALEGVTIDYLWYKDYIDENAEEKVKEHLERVFCL